MYAVFPRLRLRVNLFALPAFALLFLLEGVLPASLLLLASLLHECGHLAALRVFRVPLRRVDVEPLGANLVYDDALCPLRASAWIAFSGAFANLLTVLFCLPFLWFVPQNLPLAFFALANAFLAFLNLLPWSCLDGGRLLLDLLLLRAPPDRAPEVDRACRVVSRVSAFLLFAVLLYLSVLSAFPLWALLLSALLLAQVGRG